MVGLALGMLFAGDDQHVPGLDQGPQALDGGLQQGALSLEAEELLGQLLARQRPQPAAAAAGQDHRPNGRRAFRSLLGAAVTKWDCYQAWPTVYKSNPFVRASGRWRSLQQP